MKHWSDRLKALGACYEARRWAAKQPTYAAAWKKCQRVGWMIWLVSWAPASTGDQVSRSTLARRAAQDAVGPDVFIGESCKLRSVPACDAIRLALKRPGLSKRRR